MVVLAVMSNPEPNNIAILLNRYRSIVAAHASGRKPTNLFELERRVPAIGAQ